MLRNDLPHVSAGRRLKGTNIPPSGIHSVVPDMASTVKIFANDNTVAAANGHLRFQGGMPDGQNPLIHIEVVGDNGFLAWRFGLRNFNGRYRMSDRIRQFACPFLWAVPAEKLIDEIDFCQEVRDALQVWITFHVL